jgi:hypothetical protein
MHDRRKLRGRDAARKAARCAQAATAPAKIADDIGA